MSRLLCLSLALAAMGCTNADAVSEPVVHRLQECGFVSEGELRRLPRELYVPDGCYEACVAEASCEDIRDALCGDSVRLGRRCDERCAYRCPTGELIRADQECDRQENCSDGSDEVGCEPYTIDSCPGERRCDGIAQCPDGSDEAFCAGFVCGEREFPATERCNGIERCPLGEDEVGCARLVLVCSP